MPTKINKTKAKSTRFGKVKPVLAQSYASLESEGITPQDTLIGKVIDKSTGMIIGYTQGSTFSKEGLRQISPDLKEYEVITPSSSVKVFAINKDVALQTLGLGNSYEEEWGDYAGILKDVKEGNVEVTEWTHIPKKV